MHLCRSLILFAAVCCATLGLGFLAKSGLNERHTAHAAHEASMKAIDLLAGIDTRQSDAARAYAATGEEHYLQEFQTIQNEGRLSDRAIESLNDYGATAEEIDLLIKAMSGTNLLASLYNRAFKLAKKGELKAAVELLYGVKYNVARESARTGFSDVRNTIDKRLTDQEKQLYSREYRYYLVVFAALLLNLAALFAALLLYRLKVLMPLRRLVHSSAKLLAGEQRAASGCENLDNEIGELARTLSQYRDREALRTDLNRDFIAFLENTTDLIYFKDHDSRIKFCSQTLADLTGHSSWRDMIGKRDREIFTAQAAETYFHEELAVFQQGAALLGKIDPYNDAHGRLCWTSTSKWPVFGADGKTVVGLFGISRDISVQMRAEKKLLFNRYVVENAGPMFWIDPACDKVVYANKAMLDHIGYSSEEFCGMAVIRFDPGCTPERFAFLLKELETRGKQSAFDSRHQRKDGTLADVEIVAYLAADDERSLIIASVIDITARIKAEESMRHAREMAEEATKMKSDFLANMSHEIRTPMNAIIGMTHLALQTRLDARQKNYIEKVSRSADNLLGIIDDILDFSKIEAGKLSMEHIAFDLEEVMENLASLVGLKAEDKGLELLFSAASDIPAGLNGDPLRLGQILLNLCNNAVKFTQSGEIIVGIDTVTRSDSGIVLHFFVTDSGIGMTPEQCTRLFQPFSQADASTTRNYGGTGLGLVISKRLVELMEGRIWAESEIGKGSTFHFHAQFGVQAIPSTETPLLRGKRVLVVDDNAAARAILCGMCRHFGLAADAVSNGAQALQRFATADTPPYELVLIDWKMPQMDGIECLHRLQEQPHKTALILMSAFGRAGDMDEQNCAPPKAVLAKPITPSRLYEALCEALGPGNGVAAQAKGAAEEVRQMSGARLLLVEDNEMNQELAVELLKNAGISVVLANNGQEALDLLERDTAFDGILMDCQMPVMDGYTASRAIRSNPAFDRMPILAMTANAMASDRKKALDAGMNDHIAKPLEVKRMFATLSQWVKPIHTAAPVIPGIDQAAGLATCMNDALLYQSLLQKFSLMDFATEFAAALKDPDPLAALRCTHTLKGTAGNIGAKGVAAAAAVLEQACREKCEKPALEELAHRVEAELEPVLGRLRGLARHEENRAAPEIERITALLEKLAAQLEQHDAQSCDTVEMLLAFAHEAAFCAQQGTLCKSLLQVAQQVNEFDFEQAGVIVSTLLKKSEPKN